MRQEEPVTGKQVSCRGAWHHRPCVCMSHCTRTAWAQPALQFWRVNSRGGGKGKVPGVLPGAGCIASCLATPGPVRGYSTFHQWGPVAGSVDQGEAILAASAGLAVGVGGSVGWSLPMAGIRV